MKPEYRTARARSNAKMLLLGPDRKLQRMMRYSLSILGIYLFCTSMLWIELDVPKETYWYSVALSALCIGGALVFCVLIRCRARLGLTPLQLASWQGYHAMICIMCAYPVAPPVRGALLVLMIVVVVFCAFSLDRHRADMLVIFGIVLTGSVQLYLALTDPVVFPPAHEIVHFTIVSSMLIVVSFLASQLNFLRTKLAGQKAELLEALERIKTMAAHDELTSLPNRRFMNEVLAAEEKRHHLTNASLCVALIDIDFFKQINDHYGHAAGDEVLKGFAALFRTMLRSTDVLARWGGEEFLFLLPETDIDVAESVLNRIRSIVSPIYIPVIGTSLSVTFSAGLTRLNQHGSISDAISKADAAMYCAKKAGRNRVHVSKADAECISSAMS